MELISVVVPVYKVEKYLDRCIQSILNQTYSNLELILVDDGSPDRCGEICDEYERRDNRIKVVHKKNGGLSSARNAGLKIASGKYVGFVDSDDDIVPNMYEIMMNIAEKYNVDFVMSDYYRILNENKIYSVNKSIRGGYYNKDDLLNEIFPSLIMGENIDYGPLLSVCHCIYNRNFLEKHDINFAEDVKWSEDNLFSALVGYNAKSFYYIKEEYLYNYYQNENTITTSYRNGAWEVYSLMNIYLSNYFSDKKDYDFSRQLKIHLIYYACVCLGQTIHLNKSERKVSIKKILNSNNLKAAFKNLKFNEQVNTKLRIQLFLMKFRNTYLLEKMIERRS